MSRLYHKIALAGVGLLGGSLGHCFQSLNLADEVTGYVRRQYSVEECLRVGAVTHVLVADAAVGYGIFIDSMLEAGSCALAG